MHLLLSSSPRREAGVSPGSPATGLRRWGGTSTPAKTDNKKLKLAHAAKPRPPPPTVAAIRELPTCSAGLQAGCRVDLPFHARFFLRHDHSACQRTQIEGGLVTRARLQPCHNTIPCHFRNPPTRRKPRADSYDQPTPSNMPTVQDQSCGMSRCLERARLQSPRILPQGGRHPQRSAFQRTASPVPARRWF